MSALLEARDLVVHYRDVPALTGLSVSVAAGERIALLGANGSGKSTLLRVLDALQFPDSGTFHFAGEPITAERLEDRAFSREFRRRVGLVFQNADVQLFNPTVFDEIAFGPLQLQLPKSDIRARVQQTLQQMSLEHLKFRSPHQLSGGEKKRVALASILVLDPEVLLLDEPTAGLDPRSASEMVELLASWRGAGKTVLTATHDLDNLEDIADRVIILQDGRIIADSTPFHILHDVGLLQRARLIAAHRHTHPGGAKQPHPHVHADPLTPPAAPTSDRFGPPADSAATPPIPRTPATPRAKDPD
ncbi:MAG TPA: ABC transporter ATP-binding protein [Bryobacteraceae bacterium]|jgi:cobalt/nickel transport system ATP-binding protein|nr:ABC transporter ATP-binding protein [Bryobacteraceae bacterium]